MPVTMITTTKIMSIIYI